MINGNNNIGLIFGEVHVESCTYIVKPNHRQ